MASSTTVRAPSPRSSSLAYYSSLRSAARSRFKSQEHWDSHFDSFTQERYKPTWFLEFRNLLSTNLAPKDQALTLLPFNPLLWPYGLRR
uniref:Uncharacterized protein n=1 Tax=Timema genevievae TaxID=629358 RepID=A0A7R9JT63_TIMGE|nr:unnamed protein product [Timema genevievae]